MSLICIVTAFHLTLLISLYESDEEALDYLLETLRGSSDVSPRFLSLYILQVPMMLLSYALISYTVGLSILLLSPLWSAQWNNHSKVWLPILHISEYNELIMRSTRLL